MSMMEYFEIKQAQEKAQAEKEQAEGATVLFLCDRKQCRECSYPICSHTTHIEHAINFKKIAPAMYGEQE